MKNKMKLGMCSALFIGSLVGGLGMRDLAAYASNNEVAQQVGSYFKDVSTDYYGYEAIEWAKSQGIINGYPDGTFKPNGTITEAHFAKMFANFLGLKDDRGNLTKYTPVASDYDTYYDALAAYSVPLNGYFDNNIRNQPVKRGVIAQAIGHMNVGENSLTGSILYMLGEGITTGQNPQYEGKDLIKFFGSSNNLTRAHVATFLYRMHSQGLGSTMAYNNSDGLSLVGLANKGLNKLDSSLRVAQFGSETPSTVGGGTTINKNPNEIKLNLPSEVEVTEKDKNKVNEVMKLVSKNIVEGYKIENIVVADGFLIKDGNENVVQSYNKSNDGINNYQLLFFDREENVNMLVENLFVLLKNTHKKEDIKNSIEKVLKQGEVAMGNVLFYYYGTNIGVEWK